VAGESDFSVDISKDVLVGITGIAIESVKGAAPVTPPVKVGEVFTGRRAKGITVQRDGNTVTVDLTVNVDYGRAIPEVARELQQAVSDNIEVMTGLSVRAVNVTVQAVCLPPESADA
jgi:uncharacterized alkaline shock family protein YloU